MRLVIPLITGVFCGDCLFDGQTDGRCSIAFFSLFALLSVGSCFLHRHSLRWCFGLSLSGLCLTGGWLGITNQLQQSVYDYPQEEAVYRVLLSGKPEQKERSFLCRVLVKERKAALAFAPVNRQAILYFAKDSIVSHYKGGEELLVSTRISPPVNGKNFDEFDYARYLMHKGISGTGYVASGKWKLLDSTPCSSYRTLADAYREKVLTLYRTLGFGGDELAVLSALTVGDKTELSDTIRESYSVSGASHVLALSGLHIGLLYGLFFLLLKPLTECWRIGRCLRSFLLILLLWTFAFFTGFSSSVVRSVCMFSILALAEMSGRESLSINTLAATAFFMLLCYPVWLFDVGFQLSFLAVAAILLIHQPVYRLIPVRTRVGRYVWGLMSVSIAAQLGTAPLILLYFSRFSTHFLLTNLVVIPLVTLILYAAVFMLFLTPLWWIQAEFAYLVNGLLKALNGFVGWVEQLPYASLDGIWLYKTEVVGVYLFFVLLLCYNLSRRAKEILLCLTSLLLLCVFHAVANWYDRPQRSLVFYNVRSCPAVHCIEADGCSWLSYGECPGDKTRLKRIAANFWQRHHLQPPTEIASGFQQPNLSLRQQILTFHDCRICMVTDDRWQNKKAAVPLFIQYLYLCKGYTGELEELMQLFSPSYVILDASLPEFRKESFRNECKRFGIRFLSLSDEGSQLFLL